MKQSDTAVISPLNCICDDWCSHSRGKQRRTVKDVLCKKLFFKAAVGFPQAGGDLSLGLTLYMLAKKAILAQFPDDKCLIPHVPFSLQ